MDEFKKKKTRLGYQSRVSSTMLLHTEITIISLVSIDITFCRRRVLAWNFDTGHFFPSKFLNGMGITYEKKNEVRCPFLCLKNTKR